MYIQDSGGTRRQTRGNDGGPHRKVTKLKARIHGATLHAILRATFFTRRCYTVATFRATLRAITDERLPRYRFSLKL